MMMGDPAAVGGLVDCLSRRSAGQIASSLARLLPVAAGRYPMTCRYQCPLSLMVRVCVA